MRQGVEVYMFGGDQQLDEALFGRSPLLKVFVSSKMNGKPLVAERLAAAEAIDSLQIAKAWYWERDACASPICAEDVCLGHARTSDALVLLLGDDLTYMTNKEYEAAEAASVPCLVFLASDVKRNAAADKFVKSVRKHLVSGYFASSSELQTQVANSLKIYFAQNVRENQIARRKKRRRRIRFGPFQF